MFFRKKKKIIGMHYEGIDKYPMDIPCELDLIDDGLMIKRIKPEEEMLIPTDNIKGIEVLQEKRFMQKYYGNAVKTSKGKQELWFIVIKLEDNNIVFSGLSGFHDIMNKFYK